MDSSSHVEIEKEKALDDFDKLLVNRPNSALVQLLRKHGMNSSYEANGRVSIFDKKRGTIDEDRAVVQNVLEGHDGDGDDDFEENKKLYEGSMGSMVGMAIADAMGHRFEFMPFCYYGDPNNYLTDMGTGPGGSFELKPGQWTDDTSMGLCLADSLLLNKKWDPHDLMHRFLSWWYLGYDNAFLYDDELRSSCGLGGNISLSFDMYIRKPSPYTKAGDKNTSGNGSVMRNAPVPICYWDNPGLACRMALLQSRITHQGTEAADCCRLLTYITIKLLLSQPTDDLKTILDNIGDEFCTFVPDCVESVKHLARSEAELLDDGSGINKDRDWNWKKEEYQYSIKRIRSNSGYIGSYAMDAMAMALHVLYTTKSFSEAVIKVVNMRGDSDSVGSVVGQMAGAFYGIRSIPPEWIHVLYEWDHGEIALRGYMLSRLRSGKSYITEPHELKDEPPPPLPEEFEREEEEKPPPLPPRDGSVSPTRRPRTPSYLLKSASTSQAHQSEGIEPPAQPHQSEDTESPVQPHQSEGGASPTRRPRTPSYLLKRASTSQPHQSEGTEPPAQPHQSEDSASPEQPYQREDTEPPTQETATASFLKGNAFPTKPGSASGLERPLLWQEEDQRSLSEDQPIFLERKRSCCDCDCCECGCCCWLWWCFLILLLVVCLAFVYYVFFLY